MICQEAKEIVSKVVDRIRDRGLKVRSIIVFGSAVREGEFKPGVSDVDVVLIVDRLEDLKGEKFEDLSEHLELGVFTTGQFLELYYSGDPLTHMIWLEGNVIYDNDFYERIKSKGGPRITELTIMKLKHWGLKDFAKALKSKNDPKTCLRNIHHAVRNFARLRVARDKGLFSITDDVLLDKLDENLSKEYRKFLRMIAEHEGCSQRLILEALRLMELFYGSPLRWVNEVHSIEVERA